MAWRGRDRDQTLLLSVQAVHGVVSWDFRIPMTGFKSSQKAVLEERRVAAIETANRIHEYEYTSAGLDSKHEGAAFDLLEDGSFVG